MATARGLGEDLLDRRWNVRLGAIFFLLVAGCNARQSATPQTGPPTAEEFILYTAPDRSFSVQFPGTPKIEPTPAAPGKVKGKLYVVERGDRAYGVEFARFAAKRTVPEKELAVARDNVLRGLSGKLLTERDVSLGQHPGRDIVIDLGDGTVLRARYFLTEYESYLITAAVPKGEESSKPVEDFFSSFQLLTD
jgi:hypothetical protein